MASIWFKCELADEIIKNPNFIEQTQNIVAGNFIPIFFDIKYL